MWLGRIVSWYFLLFTFDVGGHNIKISVPRSRSELEDLTCQAKDLVEMCLTNYSTLVMTTSDLVDEFRSSDKISTIVIEREFDVDKQGIVTAYPIFVHPYESWNELETLFWFLRQTYYWNVKSPFLVLDADSNCANVKEVLRLLWGFDLLGAYYLCNDKGSTVIYTLNPFTNYAPEPWIQSPEKFDGEDRSKWTIFSINYSNGPKICNNLTYDKTKFLDGYKIRYGPPLGGYQIDNKTAMVKFLEDQLNDKDTNLFQVARAIGAEPVIMNSTEISRSGCDVDGHHYYPIDVINEQEVTSNYWEIEFSILTRKTKYLEETIEATANTKLTALTIISLMLIGGILVLIGNKEPVLNLVRMIFGMELEGEFERVTMKIIIFIAFVFSLFVTSDFLGEIQSSLSAPPRRNVETLEDLHNYKLKVHYPEFSDFKIEDANLWVTEEDQEKYLTPNNDPNDWNKCLSEAGHNSTIACILQTPYLLNYTKDRDDVYVSKKPIFKMLVGQYTREHWALKDRFHKDVAVAVEAAQVRHIFESLKKQLMKKWKGIRETEKGESYDEIINDIFNFWAFLLGLCHVIALFVFIIEVCCYRRTREADYVEVASDDPDDISNEDDD